MIRRFGVTLMLLAMFLAEMAIFYQLINGFKEGNGSIQYYVLLGVFAIGTSLFCIPDNKT